MENNRLAATGALLLAMAVAIGAFGAHGLKELLLQYNRLDTFETGVKYHFYHAFGIILCAILARQFEVNLRLTGWLFMGGIVLFSGSLYILCLTNITWLGAITPLGGVAFISGWLILAFKLIKRDR